MKNNNTFGEALYEMYYTRIHRYFSFRILDKSEAEDLAQTVFLKVFTSLKNGVWNGAGDICYIFTIARNTLIDYFRRHKHSMIVSDELVEAFSDSFVFSGGFQEYEREENISLAMKGLRKPQEQALELRFFDDMEYAAIAKIMNKQEVAVRQLVHRGIKSLKSMLTI